VVDLPPRVNLGVILADAFLEPDGRMEGFNPCGDCRVCQENCPAEAIEEGRPPAGFNRQRCLEFVYRLREVTDNEISFCGYCYRLCPVGETLQASKWRTLLSLGDDEREQLIKLAC
jgi:epoxyqueuosine reductase QueG